MCKTMLLLLMLSLAGSIVRAEKAGSFWAKGNLHTHSTESDGDVPPDQVAKWFSDHGYRFLVLSDHRKLVDPVKAKADGLLLIPGEELDTTVNNLPVHLNGIGIKTQLVPKGGTTARRALQANIDMIRADGGIPMINHPNWYYAFDHRDMLPIDRPYLLEIANMSSGCENSGDTAHIPVEQMWDILLSEGRTVYATATDDSHHYQKFDSNHDNPGRGWVHVRVKELTASEVYRALEKGDFYSSTGVELEDVSFDGKTLKVSVKPQEKATYLIRFIGKYGRIICETKDASGSCRIPNDGPDSYIRAKVISSDGKVAWTQGFSTD